MASTTTSVSGSGQLSFGGMTSGLDTDSIIEQLVTVDSQTLVRYQNDEEEVTTQKDTYTTIDSDLSELQSLVSDLRTTADYGEFSASSSDEDALVVTATTSAAEGNYTVKILALAEAESISSDSFEDSDTALGISGEISINGKAMEVSSSDSLTDIKNNINSLDNGVTASILTVSNGDLRLILTADDQGTDGFTMANVGATDVLGTLGLTDGTKTVRETEDGAVYSLSFDSASATIGSLTGMSSDASGTVGIRGTALDIDLSTDTLTSIRNKINALGISGVSASIETVTDGDTPAYRLAITGTENFTDGGNVLETLGILEGGTADVQAEFQTSSLDATGQIDVTTATALTDLGAVAGETITISGTGSDGGTVNKSFTVKKDSTVDDLLSAVESAFSDEVTAEISNGKIVVRGVEGGETSLAVNLTANSEDGGTLDFGAMETVTAGRDRQLSAGQDAKILVNNTTIIRSSNEISDAIAGVKLSLRDADADTNLTVTITRDTDAIKEKIQSVVDAYNELVTYIDEQSAYDEKTNIAGPLTGDLTARTVVSRLRKVLQSTVDVDDSNLSSLTEVGISFTDKGKLEIDSSTLNEALESDMDSVISLFTVNRDSTNSDIKFVYNTTDTAAGSYSVVVTQAAEKASVSSAGTTATEAGSLTVTDNYGNSFSIDYEAGDLVADIANLANTESEKTYQEIVVSDEALQTAEGSAVTQDTSINDIAGVEVKTGDTITITGTNHNGKSFQKRLTFSTTDSYTIDDVLTAIEKATSSTVTASLDSEGHIMLQDKTSGSSDLTLSISTTVSGLTFGTFATEQEGRDAVTVNVSSSTSGALTLSHKAYGSSNTFTVSGGEGLGITSGSYAGVDVAGTINGQTGTGKGQSLAASSSDTDSKGISVLVTSTKEEVAAGTANATITLTSGIADSLYTELSNLTDSMDGYVQAKLDSLDLSLDRLDDNIDAEQERIDQRRAMYEKRFSALEVALSRLQNIQSQLSSLLGSI